MKLVTAKKQHRCDECGRLIEVGDRYWQKHENYGDAINFKEHGNCSLAEHDGRQVLPEGFNQNRKMKVSK